MSLRPLRVALTACGAGVVLTMALSGCGREPASPTVPVLVRPTAERLAQLTGAADAQPGDATPRPASNDVRGAAGFTDDAGFEAFATECDAIQPTGPPKSDDLTGGYGEVYRGKTPPTGLKDTPGDNLFRWVEGNPEYLDPNKIAESAGNRIGSQMFETLYIAAPGNTPPLPGAAESHTLSEDGRVYTFTLREKLLWSDGTPLTAHDFEYAWKRGLAPETASRNAQQLWFIENAQAYNQGKAEAADVGVVAKDDRTLVVTLESRAPFFIDLVTYIAFAPVPKHVIDEHGAQWVRPDHIVANGAFKMVEWKQRDYIKLVKNELYWDAANVALDGTIIFSSADERRNLTLYETGQAHWVTPIPQDFIREAIQTGRNDLHIDQEMCTYYFAFRTDRPPFDHPLLRRAIHLAVDKNRLTKHVLSGFQPPATNLVTDMFRGTINYVPPPGESYDPDLAKDLLAEAGFPGGKGLPPIEIIYNTFEMHKLITEFVRRNLKENLGVDVTIYNMEWKSLLKRAKAGDFQISRTSWCADFPDPLNYLEVHRSSAPNNYAAYKNPAYDRMLDKIRSEGDRRTRNVMMCAAEKGLNRDVPFMPMYFYTRPYLLRPEVRGFLPQYQDHHLLKFISLDGEG